MLFEELMMQNRFDITRDVAITNQPTGDSITSSSYIVTWGQRGRIGDDKLRERVLFSASRVLPEFNSQAAMDLVPTPIEMVQGNSWPENLTISPNPAPSSLKMTQLNSFSIPTSFAQAAAVNDAQQPVDNYNRYYQKPLPSH